MSEYYAVIRSTDHLSHYGVKGMKWGVRKAIATGNKKALERHFRRAARKLAKLQDVGLHPKKYAAKAAAYGTAAAGTAAIAGGYPYLKKRAIHNLADSMDWLKNESKVRTYQRLNKYEKPVRIGSAAASAGLAVASGVNAYRAANSSKYRKKAVEFRKAMDESFKGTKYAGQHVATPRKKKKKRGENA